MAENSLDAGATRRRRWPRGNKIDSVLGIGATIGSRKFRRKSSRLLEARQAARKAKDFKRADAIRDELKAKGWVIEDTPKGPKLKKI